MFTQTINNLLPVFDVVSVKEITLPKSALKINSLVDITVIDKAQSLYRIVAGGKVFETKLPLPVNIGESFIATVINNNPTVFRLNSLFNISPDGKVLTEILMKLNLPVTKSAQEILKGVLESDKPVLKSKLKRLIELISESDTEIDPNSVELFAQLVWSSDGADEFDKDDLKHFYYSFEEIAQKIVIQLNHAYKKNPYDSVFTSLNNWLIIDADVMMSESKLMIYLMKHFESSLSEWLDDNANASNTVYSLLNSYFIQMQYRKSAGLNNGMFLIRSDEELQYASYELKNPDEQDHVLVFRLQMNPSSLGRINIDGIYSHNNLKLNFTATPDAKEILEANSGDLKAALNKKTRLTTSIQSNVFGQSKSQNFFQLHTNRSINVTA